MIKVIKNFFILFYYLFIIYIIIIIIFIIYINNNTNDLLNSIRDSFFEVLYFIEKYIWLKILKIYL